MKTGLAKITIVICCLFMSIALHAKTNETNTDKLKGVWQYSLPDAPYGYQEGTIEFKQTAGKPSAVVNIQNSTIEIKEIKKDGDNYTCNLYVDGMNVKLQFKNGTDKMEGTVNADGWDMPVTFTPVK